MVSTQTMMCAGTCRTASTAGIWFPAPGLRDAGKRWCVRQHTYVKMKWISWESKIRPAYMSRLDFTLVVCNTFLGWVKLYDEAVRYLFWKNELLHMGRLPFFFFFFIRIKIFGKWKRIQWEANCRSDKCKKLHYAPLFLLPQFLNFVTLAKKKERSL